jgi:hypothetical protein
MGCAACPASSVSTAASEARMELRTIYLRHHVFAQKQPGDSARLLV